MIKRCSVFILSGVFFLVTGSAFGCPCNPCKCSPCTCGGSHGGGKTSSSKPPPTTSKSEPGKTTTSEARRKHREAKRNRDRGNDRHTSVGVSANIDLGGLGARRPEADPFAVPNEPVATTRTLEKIDRRRAKRKVTEIVGTTNDLFAGVELTGGKAKSKTASVPIQE